MSISQDYEKYNFDINIKELPAWMQKAYNSGYPVEIKINGYFYNIVKKANKRGRK